MIRKFMKILVGAVILLAIVLLLLVGNIFWFTEKSNLEDAEASVVLSPSEEISMDKQELESTLEERVVSESNMISSDNKRMKFESSENKLNQDSKVSEKFLQDRLEKLKLEYHEDKDFQVLEEKKTLYQEIVCSTPEIESSKIPENSDSDFYTTGSDVELFGLTREEYVDTAVQNHTKYTKGVSNYTQQDIDILASVIFNEAGCETTTRHKEMVAAVVVNRVNFSKWFPDTIKAVIQQENQYLPEYAEYGSYYMNLAMESKIWDECRKIAEWALCGEIDCPENVVFQANVIQGDGIYEIGYTSYSTTYFCYVND